MTKQGVSRPQGWVPDLRNFGARLALLRQAMGWGNVAEAATSCGIPIASWRNWERDNREPRGLLNVCMKIAGVTGVDYQWLALGPNPEVAASARTAEGSTLQYPTVGERVVRIMGDDRPQEITRSVRPNRTRPINRARAASKDACGFK